MVSVKEDKLVLKLEVGVAKPRKFAHQRTTRALKY